MIVFVLDLCGAERVSRCGGCDRAVSMLGKGVLELLGAQGGAIGERSNTLGSLQG